MIKIEESTVTELQKAMQSGELTSRELVLYYLSRIAEIDKCDGGLNSVIEINPDALMIADSLDEVRKNGTIFSPLHGIPIMLKDNISTGDKMRTSAGSLALQDNYALADAHIVTRLREAGALILGKVNLTEFANHMSDMPGGYSSRGGQTLNPYDKTKCPGGSSTGSAVAVTANLCSVAVGTETSGSIIAPSQSNGIVGIKPTSGLLSNDGIIPISFTYDTAGPMTRTVADAVILLGALANKEKQVDYTQYLDKSGPEGVRIGIYGHVQEWFGENEKEELKFFEENIMPILKANGAECVELPESSLKIEVDEGPIMEYEFKCGINNYLASFGNKNSPKNLQEIILFNQNHAKEALKYGQSDLLRCQNNTSGNLTEPDYLNAIVKREQIIKEFDDVFVENNVDVIFCLGGTRLSAYTGFPSMTIPFGMRKDNLPFGSFWTARRFDEKMLIRVAYALEQILNARVNPLN